MTEREPTVHVPYPPEPPFGHQNIEQLAEVLKPTDKDGKPLEGRELLGHLYKVLYTRWGLRKEDAFKPDTWILRGEESWPGSRGRPEEYYVRALVLALEGRSNADIALALGVYMTSEDELEDDAPMHNASDLSSLRTKYFSSLVNEIAKNVREKGKKIHGLIFPQYDEKTAKETETSKKIDAIRAHLGLKHRSQVFDLTSTRLPSRDGKGFYELDLAMYALDKVIVQGKHVVEVERDLVSQLSAATSRTLSKTDDATTNNLSALMACVLSPEAKQIILDQRGGLRETWCPEIAHMFLASTGPDKQLLQRVVDVLGAKGYKGDRYYLRSYINVRGKKEMGELTVDELTKLDAKAEKKWSTPLAAFIYHYAKCTLDEAIAAAQRSWAGKPPRKMRSR